MNDSNSKQTLSFYEHNAGAFWERTRDHDVSHNIAALLRFVEGTPPFSILDFGCGPGRDLKALKALGHEAVGLEGAHALAEMARAHSGCEVWEQDFLALDLPPERFDGIFANASLFHVPVEHLPRVLSEMHRTLKPRSVLFSSNPHGDDTAEVRADGRFGAYHSPDAWRRYVREAGFEELTHFFRPEGKPCAEQPWFASVWRKM